MTTQQLVTSLEDALRQLGVRVRRERGSFRGGFCVVDGESVIILNRQHPPEAHLNVLARALRDLPVDQIYVRPAVREALDRLWSAPEVDPWSQITEEGS